LQVDFGGHHVADFIGQTLGHYRIEVSLGSGGKGQVFRDMHVYLDRPAAIKVLQANLATKAEFRKRFLQEAKAVAALRHPNIVEIYEFGEQDGNLYLVMELMVDGSVRTLLSGSAGHLLPLYLGLDLVCQATKGLAAANCLKMVHRDIKPDNLLLTRLSDPQQGGSPYLLKISDFGLARSGLSHVEPEGEEAPLTPPSYRTTETSWTIMS
jgi:eukaryotic-like serine/threonine-protein kinase